MPELYFEDFQPGEVKTFGGVAVEHDAMVAFARAFDPQPFHLDEAAARGTFVGRLIASGWYTAALQMRMVCDAWMLRAAAMGSPGLDEMTWLAPVVVGDVLSVRETITETKTSRSRPEMGLVRSDLETLNARGETVMRQTQWVMFARRGVAPGGAGHAAGRTADPEAGSPEAESAAPATAYFDDIVVGRREILGRQVVTTEEIIRFATDFDPQPFHMDEASARASAFGGLAASGWHTAALWMKSLVATRYAAAARADAEGRPRPVFGPSPGLTKLRWLKPVRPGDTITFATTATDKRLSASRPGWGIAFSHNTGHNQHGELVYSFEGRGFVAQAGAAAALA